VEEEEWIEEGNERKDEVVRWKEAYSKAAIASNRAFLACLRGTTRQGLIGRHDLV
jgi:hypothetical protein